MQTGTGANAMLNLHSKTQKSFLVTSQDHHIVMKVTGTNDRDKAGVQVGGGSLGGGFVRNVFQTTATPVHPIKGDIWMHG